MKELPLTSKYRTNASDPVDDPEREDLAARLGEEFTAGRMTQDEYRNKLDLVYKAGTLGELVPVVESLPPRITHNVPEIVRQSDQLPGTVNPSRNMLPVALAATAGLGALIALIILLVILL